MRFGWIAAAAALVMCAPANAAKMVVIDFNGTVPAGQSNVSNPPTYYEDGLAVSRVNWFSAGQPGFGDGTDFVSSNLVAFNVPTRQRFKLTSLDVQDTSGGVIDIISFPNFFDDIGGVVQRIIIPAGQQFRTYAVSTPAASRLFVDGRVNSDNYAFTTELTAPVPEPASWAMMIGGIGLSGGALRVRRRRALLA